MMSEDKRPCSGDSYHFAIDHYIPPLYIQCTCGTCEKHYSHGGKCAGWGGKLHARAAGVELRRGRE